MTAPDYHTTKWFSEKLLSVELIKCEVKMNTPMYFGLSILDMSKVVIYEYWCDCKKPKYRDKSEQCYTYTGSYAVHVKSEDVHADLTGDVKKRFIKMLRRIILIYIVSILLNY